MPMINDAEIVKRFTSHAPSPTTAVQHDAVRRAFLAVAREVAGLLPDGRERSLAYTSLEEASFWAHAAVARFVEDD